MPRTLKLYIDDIQESIKKIEEYVKGYNYQKFVKDTKTIDAVIRNFSVIGEAARHIPENVQEKYPQMPWHEITGMRNKIIHEYFGLNEEILWKTIQEDLPRLKQELLKISEKISQLPAHSNIK